MYFYTLNLPKRDKKNLKNLIFHGYNCGEPYFVDCHVFALEIDKIFRFCVEILAWPCSMRVANKSKKIFVALLEKSPKNLKNLKQISQKS